jgi:UDP-glucuronate 4-epimerase
VTLMDLIKLFEESAGKKATLSYHPRHPADVSATWADIGKARRLLGWEPQTDLRTGVGNVVAWYRQNQDWARDIDTL